MDDVDTDLGLVHLADGVGKRLDGTLGVGLDDQVELLELVWAHLLEQGLKGDVLDLVLLLDTGLESALLSKVAGIAGVLEDAELVAGCRNRVETEDLDGVGRTRLVLVLTVLVEHGANGAVALTRDDGIPNVQRAARDEQRGDRTAPAIELCLDDVAGSKGIGVGLELENVSLEKDGLEQLIDTDVLSQRRR